MRARRRSAPDQALTQAQWLFALALAGAFLLLGAIVMARPTWGAALFGIAAPDRDALAYVRAVGVRDVALGLYIAALSVWSSRPALGILLGVTTVIPVLDLGLILALRGLSSPLHLVLHGASAAVFAGAALWVLRSRASP